VTVIYGHVHQIQYNQIGNISFHAVMATAWPWPYPQSYTQQPSYLPELTVQMNRADPSLNGMLQAGNSSTCAPATWTCTTSCQQPEQKRGVQR